MFPFVFPYFPLNFPSIFPYISFVFPSKFFLWKVLAGFWDIYVVYGVYIYWLAYMATKSLPLFLHDSRLLFFYFFAL